LGVHGQSKAPQAIGAKPRLVKGHPDLAQYLNRLRGSGNKQDKYLLKLIDEALDGHTPSEVAGIEVDDENKWLTLIQNASAKKCAN
jgi:hypothetical protein